ncbi:signal peptide peptidase SppA [Shewanella sp. C32]|uniref:Signal peptide peptidase SppA n=1 Tax=Shewanella electrica TaxID=515560 RepID=A0ABT2FNJ8_9GAMM|nr:signal peptide peptidase SppA [Shewanella electrica]MCH1926457.1 signal peptide peptidase SppA [Shewanella electrica]MCS4557913.1 signal peptide peptidase SppA [Shewanella electrica]
MSAKPLTTKNTLILIWNVINFVRKLILNIIFFPILFIFLIAVIVGLASEKEVTVDDGSALVLNLAGTVVDQKTEIDPLETLMSQGNQRSAASEVLLSEVLDTIDSAAQDSRISALVIDLDDMASGGLTKILAIGRHIDEFKKSGKPVVAMADFYDQYRYLLASYADTVYLNEQGQVLIQGFGSYPMYYKEALDKLKIKAHVFRVGTYKSAVEPYLRNDMSDAAKEANRKWMGDIWQVYAEAAAHNRGLQPESFHMNADDYVAALQQADGDGAQMAVNLKWVDKLVTAEEFRQQMVQLVGEAKTGHSFKQIDYYNYAALIAPPPAIIPTEGVGIIVAKGNILNGEQPAGTIGGQSTSALLRKARFDNKIKAVVLRVDSPGGSAFASEQIRQEVLALKAAGKPVVVSMSSLAASGGYWISASADYIYANPGTITGSIGIFGMITTFEDSLAALGIHSDGVATSDVAGISLVRPLPEGFKTSMQMAIERGYQNFINMVAKSRHMTPEQVDSIAQGRVWSGVEAKKIGLVDDLGDIDQAITKAAQLASLDQYDVRVIEKELTPEQKMLKAVLSNAEAYLPDSVTKMSATDKLLRQFSHVAEDFAAFDDPQNRYLYCEECSY